MYLTPFSHKAKAENPSKTTATIHFRILVLVLVALQIDLYAQQSHSVIDTPIVLSLNENAFGPSPLVDSAIRAELPRLNRYIGPEADELIKLIAAKEGVATEQVILGEILEQLGIALELEGIPGGEFIYSVPGYPALADAAFRVGGAPVTIPLNNLLENDLVAIEAAVTDRTKAVFLVNPHNPSGTVTDKTTLHNFIERVSHRTLVILDEAYLEFSDDFKGRTAAAHVRDGRNVLVFRTFGKAYGLAGLSIGYAIGPASLLSTLKQKGLGDKHGLNRLAVAAAKAALTDTTYLYATAQTIIDERRRWEEFLDKEGLHKTSSQGNFVFFDTGRSHTEVARKLREHGIVIGRVFEPYSNWIRITVGLPKQNQYTRHILKEILE